MATVLGTDHIEADFHVGFARLLKALVTADQFRIGTGDDIALAQQRPTGRLARRHISHWVLARKRPGIIEVFMLIDGLILRTAGDRCQHQRQPGGTHMK
ncbi:hypothetical protein D3C71_1747550 [compost metagenome]